MANDTEVTTCFRLVYANGVEADNGYGTPHFYTESYATEDASRFEHPRWGKPAPLRLEAPCVVVSCSECDYDFDEEEWTNHFDSLAEGLKTAGECEWKVTGDTALCPSCVAEQAVPGA